MAGVLRFFEIAAKTPDVATPAVDRSSGKPYCIPVATGQPRSTLDILKEHGLILPESPAFRRDLTPDSYLCIEASNAQASVEDACLATIPGEVGFWGARLGAYADTVEFPYVRSALTALRPLAAMADVVWTNLLDWSSAAVLRLMLVVAGGLLSLWLVVRFLLPTGSPLLALFALVVVTPLGSLAFATGLNWAALEFARGLLKLGVGTTDLVLAMIGCTAFTLSVLGKTVLMMAQEHLAEVKKQM
jgi:hypothetical protein